jgi:hypothetical protein
MGPASIFFFLGAGTTTEDGLKHCSSKKIQSKLRVPFSSEIATVPLVQAGLGGSLAQASQAVSGPSGWLFLRDGVSEMPS